MLCTFEVTIPLGVQNSTIKISQTFSFSFQGITLRLKHSKMLHRQQFSMLALAETFLLRSLSVFCIWNLKTSRNCGWSHSDAFQNQPNVPAGTCHRPEHKHLLPHFAAFSQERSDSHTQTYPDLPAGVLQTGHATLPRGRSAHAEHDSLTTSAGSFQCWGAAALLLPDVWSARPTFKAESRPLSSGNSVQPLSHTHSKRPEVRDGKLADQ